MGQGCRGAGTPDDRILRPRGMLELFLWYYPEARQPGQKLIQQHWLGLNCLYRKGEHVFKVFMARVQ